MPAELIELNTFSSLVASVAAATDAGLRRAGLRRLHLLLVALDSRGLPATARGVLARYRDPLIVKLTAG